MKKFNMERFEDERPIVAGIVEGVVLGVIAAAVSPFNVWGTAFVAAASVIAGEFRPSRMGCSGKCRKSQEKAKPPSPP